MVAVPLQPFVNTFESLYEQVEKLGGDTWSPEVNLFPGTCFFWLHLFQFAGLSCYFFDEAINKTRAEGAGFEDGAEGDVLYIHRCNNVNQK